MVAGAVHGTGRAVHRYTEHSAKEKNDAGSYLTLIISQHARSEARVKWPGGERSRGALPVALAAQPSAGGRRGVASLQASRRPEPVAVAPHHIMGRRTATCIQYRAGERQGGG
jgi:hypothetical protein